jgi:hypothetical protein
VWWAVVFGSVAALIGLALPLGGAALVLAHALARDDDGYDTPTPSVCPRRPTR